MRVAILADANSRRAPGSYDAESLAAALSRRDHDVRLVTASPAGTGATTTGDFRIVRVPVTTTEPATDDALMPMIGEISRFLVDEYTGEPPDVVLCHGWAYGMAAALAANRCPVATVQAFTRVSDGGPDGGGIAPGSSETATKIESLLARNATMVTAACTDDM